MSEGMEKERHGRCESERRECQREEEGGGRNDTRSPAPGGGSGRDRQKLVATGMSRGVTSRGCGTGGSSRRDEDSL